MCDWSFPLVCSTRDGIQDPHAPPDLCNSLKSKILSKVLVPNFSWVHKGYQERGTTHSFAGRNTFEWQNRVLCCKLPFHLKLMFLVRAAFCPWEKSFAMFVLLSGQELAQHLGNITQLMSLLADDVTVLINMHLGEVEDRFALCKGGEWTQEEKATVQPSCPQISKGHVYVLDCLFLHCMFDWWGVCPWKHGKIAIRYMTFATESEPALYFLFVFSNLSSYRRGQDRQRKVPWGLGEADMSHSSSQSMRLQRFQGASSGKMETTPFGGCRFSRISWKKPKKTGQWDLKESQAKGKSQAAGLLNVWRKKKKSGRKWRAGNDSGDKVLGMIEKESVDPSTHCHTPRWSAYNGSHPRGRHRLPEASWVGRLERWVSSGFRRDPVSASKEESYQGRDAMFTSGLHMQLHMCSPTYTLAHVPDTHIHGKKQK